MALAYPFDGITFHRTEPRQINMPGRAIKPHRLNIILQIRGKTWRRIPLEVSADEGGAGAEVDRFAAPSLACFGLTSPKTTAGLVMDYQVAQKIHACTEPHTASRPNDRVRDVVDLYLLKTAFYENEHPASLAHACRDLFAVREKDVGRSPRTPSRTWPPPVIPHPHWQKDFETYAAEIGLNIRFSEPVEQLNGWITEIDEAGNS